ncbi:type II secretion system protein [Candidatus Pelagibacter sp.]|nr:type II secretion system protein [Candidatus Pelagibacter sp.]
MDRNGFTLIELLVVVVIIIFLRPSSLAEITESQKKIIKSHIILVHEGMISLDEVFKKTKIFDKSGILGIGKSEMSEEEFKTFFKKESLHHGY